MTEKDKVELSWLIFGPHNTGKLDKHALTLSNYILAIGKHAIHISRFNMIKDLGGNTDAVYVFRQHIRSRIKIEFEYMRLHSILEKFKLNWAHNDVLCSLSGNNELELNM